MKPLLKLLAAASVLGLGISTTPVSAQQPIRIGVPTAIQLQVGRDTQNAAKLAADEINAKGGVLGRKLEIVVADETENPEQGIAAIKKLTADDKADVLIGGYTSGVTLAQLPHISQAKTIYIGVGAASPAITAKVKADYGNYKYIFRAFPINAAHQARALVDFINGKLKGDMNITKIAIVGENAKWVQDLVPILKKGAVDGGSEVKLAEFFDTSTSDFSPLFAKVKDFRRAVPDRDPVARLLRRVREAMVRRAGSDPDRRHRRQEPGCRLLHPRGRQGQQRDRRHARDPRAADAEDHSVLG